MLARQQMELSIFYHQIQNFQSLILRISFQHLPHIFMNLSSNLHLTARGMPHSQADAIGLVVAVMVPMVVLATSEA